MGDKQERPQGRTLETDIPELIEYLEPGMRVLDVGCGNGTITLDVAEAVYPGEVTGIDPCEERISEARERAAESIRDGNISFNTGDSHILDFPKDSFDIVYSHTALHFMFDPITALMEQKRVAKTGGWVVASGVRDNFLATRYPDCPQWLAVTKALDRYHQTHLAELKDRADSAVQLLDGMLDSNPSAMIYYDMRAGRKCPEWFMHAGIDNPQISVKAEHLQCVGTEYLTPHVWDLVLWKEPESAGERQVALWLEGAISEGFLDPETLEQAKEELLAWYEDPRAFNYWTLVFAAGTA